MQSRASHKSRVVRRKATVARTETHIHAESLTTQDRRGRNDTICLEPNERDDVVDQRRRIFGIIIRMQTLVKWIA
ncbi:unnamed protein product [Lasius platythorax]|uniref:Uncharacterized protein n=1 Tax=Lasius platythorax TaxID=488582 RepID=A0AAV2P2F2_9HYME